ncbi:hypothetical protein RB195_017583 [Necator americanus]
MASAGSAFRPYYRPDLVSVPDVPLRKLYSDPEPEASSPGEHGANKTRRKRTTFTQHQATILEREYLSEHYMIRDKRAQLAESLGLSEAQVKTWFQNRRAKDKREKKSDSPHRSPAESLNVSVKEEPSLDISQSSSLLSPSPSTNATPTPPPQLHPIHSPVIQNHQTLSTLLKPTSLPDYTNYLAHLGLAPIDSLPLIHGAAVQKADAFCAEAMVKDIYKIPPSIYDQTFSSIYNQIPVNASPMAVVPPAYIPEPLAPVEMSDNSGAESTAQLTAL